VGHDERQSGFFPLWPAKLGLSILQSRGDHFDQFALGQRYQRGHQFLMG
jgi:hypothetical protein